MMTDRHLENSIRLLLQGMQSIARHLGEKDYDPDYVMSEAKLEMLNRERLRRGR